MLARGADSDKQDTNGNTVLHMLVIYQKQVTYKKEKPLSESKIKYFFTKFYLFFLSYSNIEKIEVLQKCTEMMIERTFYF